MYEKLKLVLRREENMVGKGENTDRICFLFVRKHSDQKKKKACHRYFLLFQNFFHSLALKG